MKYIFYTLLAFIIIGWMIGDNDKGSGPSTSNTPSAADISRYDDCQEAWKRNEDLGIVRLVGMVNTIPTFSIDRSIWASLDYRGREEIMDIFVCAVAGPGKTLTKAQVTDAGGLVLATLDWGKFEVVR